MKSNYRGESSKYFEICGSAVQNYSPKKFVLTAHKLYEMTYYTYSQTSIEYSYFFIL